MSTPAPRAPLRLAEIRSLALRFVPAVAADRNLREYGARSWLPSHEIGHFLVATARECREPNFGLDDVPARYAIVRELGAMSVSPRLLRRAGHAALADLEIEVTSEDTLGCTWEPWCRRAVRRLLRRHGVVRLPTRAATLATLLARKHAQTAAHVEIAQAS